MAFKKEQIEHTPASLLTLDEAAQRMNVEPQYVRSMIENNQVPGIKQGGEWRVDSAQLDLYTSTEKRIAAAMGSDEVVDAPASAGRL